MDKRRRVDTEEELGRDGAESRSSDNAKEKVEPSSSKDHFKRSEALRERPAESEEEDERTKQRRIADPTGQKRTNYEAVTTPSHSRAKAKSTDPVGQKKKSASASE